MQSNVITNSNWKKGKNYYHKNLTVQNSSNLHKSEETLKLSLDDFNDITEYNNDNNEICIMKRKCPFYIKYMESKRKIKELLFSIKKIKALNEILFNSLEKQTKLYQTLINENKKLKEDLFLISSQKKFLFLNRNKRTIKLSLNSDEKKNKGINIKQYLDKEIKSLSSFSLKNIFDLQENTEEFENLLKTRKKLNINKKRAKNINEKESQYSEGLLLTKSPSVKNYKYNTLINNKSPIKHYELIKDYTKQQNMNFISDKMKRSFLSENIDYETLIQKNKVLNELISITKSEKYFISTLKNSSYDVCYKYYEMISLLINDHKEILKLSLRMKDFISNSILLIDGMIENNTMNILLKNICEVLSCQNSSLFILDNIFDSLIVYSNNDSDKNKKRIPKDEGIIGDCFTKNKLIRIDDAKKSILCYPLVDKQGNTFGVIEGINKLNPPFNSDDEELIKLLSFQTSAVLRYFNSNADNRYLMAKLNDIINYIINLMNINSKFDFTEKTEKALLNIFNCSNSRFYFIENEKIIYYNNHNKEKKVFDINMGIIGKVVKIKNIYGIQNIKNCAEYNSIIDIETYDSVLTMPIFEYKTKNVKGVAQINYIGTFDRNNKPKDFECKLIKKFRKCIKYWLYYHGF